MLEPMKRFPGSNGPTFLSGLVSALMAQEFAKGKIGGLQETIYLNHGYCALEELKEIVDVNKFSEKFPLCLHLLKHAQKLIFHSENTKQLAMEMCPGPPDK